MIQFASPSALGSPITIRPTSAFYSVLAALLQYAGRETETASSVTLCAGANVSRQFVRNLLPKLTTAGILSIDGRAGYRLTRPLSKISVFEVLEAIDGPVELDVDDLPAALSAGGVRTLRITLDGVADDVAARLGAVTLAALARE